ncbi:MAG TPA: hypothetical protein VER98_12985, partial [Terriglobia bacterium]|nr:hypothetical protein [Terriglobia bacterium]
MLRPRDPSNGTVRIEAEYRVSGLVHTIKGNHDILHARVERAGSPKNSAIPFRAEPTPAKFQLPGAAKQYNNPAPPVATRLS